MNEKIHLRIKQLLGSTFNKGRTEVVDDRKGTNGEKKLGRGKWHYSSD